MPLKDRIKQIIKLVLSVILYYTGMTYIYQTIQMRDKAIILLYHKIADSLSSQIDFSPDGMIVDGKTFCDQMEFLSNNYNVVSLDSLIELVKEGKALPRNLCVITFDDGLKEVYDYAFPILKKLKLPATVFLASNFIEGKRWFWEERVKFLLAEIYQLNKEKVFNNAHNIFEILPKYELHNYLSIDKERVPAYLMNYIHILRMKSSEWRDSLIENLEEIFSQNDMNNKRLFLNWEEICEMANSGILFGDHTESHCNLTMISRDEAVNEISNSKRKLETKLGKLVDTFAFPYGKYNASIKSLVEEVGFIGACSTEGGFVSKDSDMYSLKRINIHQDVSFSKTFFSCRILRMLNIY